MPEIPHSIQHASRITIKVFTHNVRLFNLNLSTFPSIWHDSKHDDVLGTHTHTYNETLDTVMLMFFQSIVYQTHTHIHRQRRSHVWSDTFNGHFVFEDNSIAYSNSNSNSGYNNTKTITTSAVTCCMFRVLYDVCNWSSHGNGKWENRILEMTNFRETDFVHTERESTHSMHIAGIYTLYSMYAHVYIEYVCTQPACQREPFVWPARGRCGAGIRNMFIKATQSTRIIRIVVCPKSSAANFCE